MESDVTPLANDCLAHVEREETVLCAVRETLLQIRSALLHHDMDALAAALLRQAEDMRVTEEVRQLQEKVQSQVAVGVGLAPKSITLQMLAGHIGGKAGEQLLLARGRLRRLHVEIERLNRDNVVLVRHGLDLLRNLLVAITGGIPGGEGYGPAGSPREGVCGSLLQARG